jgi:hypothetical protein
MRPYARADYNLTLSHSRLRSPAFHLNECRRMFPQLFKNGKTKGKWSLSERGSAEVGADVMSKNRDFMEHEQCHPMPELTVTPIHGWL